MDMCLWSGARTPFESRAHGPSAGQPESTPGPLRLSLC